MLLTTRIIDNNHCSVSSTEADISNVRRDGVDEGEEEALSSLHDHRGVDELHVEARGSVVLGEGERCVHLDKINPSYVEQR